MWRMLQNKFLTKSSSEVDCEYPLEFQRQNEVTEMGMFNPKNRKVICAIIAVLLVLAMVVPMVLSLLVY